MSRSIRPALGLLALALGACGSATPAPAGGAAGCTAPPETPTESCGYVVGGCCYGSSAEACAAAGCAPDACTILESFPAQIECTSPTASAGGESLASSVAKQDEGEGAGADGYGGGRGAALGGEGPASAIAGDEPPDGAEAPPSSSAIAGDERSSAVDGGEPPSSASASPAGERIVRMARRMVRRRTIVRGSCFDYADRVFSRAGYRSDSRERVYSGPIAGPYADLSLIAPGDWLFIVTHPERDPPSTHSVIFVRWLDRAAGRAEVASYAGGGARRPGGLVPYDLTRTYRITRASGRPWR